MVCGMKRGTSEVDLCRVQVQIGDPTQQVLLQPITDDCGKAKD